eukprot:SAG31_NODE_14550_length_799_cov_41.752857_1_plen_29_part_01
MTDCSIELGFTTSGGRWWAKKVKRYLELE